MSGIGGSAGRVAMVVLGCLITALASAIAAIVAFFGVAWIADAVCWAALAAVTAAAAVAVAVTPLLTRGRAPTVRRRARMVVPAVVVVAVLVAGQQWTFTPFDDRLADTGAPAGLSWWTVAGGERLAYLHLAPPPGVPPRTTPIVYLHGGPGISEMDEVAATFYPIIEEGFHLWVYDQIGGGRSDRLADPAGYTLQRHVDDLELVRQQIGADQLILIGHSWGATLAAHYLAQHPEPVARVVFSSPGDLTLGGTQETGSAVTDRLPASAQEAIRAFTLAPRSVTAYLLTIINPRSAHDFAGDEEIDRRYAKILAAATPGLLCDRSLPVPRVGSRAGFYANALTVRSAAPDPASRLRALDTPVLVLRPECDYIPWSVAVRYRDLFRNAQLVYLAGAGHQSYLEKPGAYFGSVVAFLTGTALPIPPYTASELPSDETPSP